MSLDAIRAAVAAGDPDEAMRLAALRAAAGEALPAADAARVAPGLGSVTAVLYLAAIAEGDLAGALLDAIERDDFPVVVPGIDVLTGALWAAWRRGEPDAIRARVVRAARRRVLGDLGDLACALAVDLGRALGVDDVRRALDRLARPGDRELVAHAEKALRAAPDEIVARLPDLAPPPPPPATVRAAARPGRNDLCPCGSGKKYKKCCADKDAVAAPVAATGAPDAAAIGELTVRELARVDLGALDEAALLAAFTRAFALRRWELAQAAAEAWAARVPDRADELRAELAAHALDLGQVERGRALIARLADPAALDEASRLHLALLDHQGDRLALVEEAARAALRAADDLPTVDLAHALLRAAPALGVLVTRGLAGSKRVADVDVLLDVVEDVRADLDLPPGDVGAAIVATLDKVTPGARERQAEEQRRLARELAAAEARARTLEREVAELRERLPTAAPAPPLEPAERRALRDKIEALEALIREGNEERAELRRQLAERPAAVRRDEPAPATAADDADEGFEADQADAPRGVLLPTFARAADTALRELPARVAAEALRTIGELAAGTPFAWAHVKQAQDLRPPLLMARVGIHHRLLFRAEAGRLEILDAVTRESLMHALKRLRRG